MQDAPGSAPHRLLHKPTIHAYISWCLTTKNFTAYMPLAIDSFSDRLGLRWKEVLSK
jgi:hypothetical protein